MSHDPTNADRPTEEAPLAEQLVAYLDGELDDEASRRIEQLLATDPKMRETLEQFEGTWELLDHLQRVDVGELFTQSTLEMVAVAAASDVEKQQAEAPRRRRRQWVIGGAVALPACLAGFLSVALFRPSQNEQLLQDLPVLERLDQYREVNDFEFLKRLLEHEKDLFSEEVADGS